ncbi:hypothetical protein MRX96_009147 [Rhipicephalus microplus]
MEHVWRVYVRSAIRAGFEGTFQDALYSIERDRWLLAQTVRSRQKTSARVEAEAIVRLRVPRKPSVYGDPRADRDNDAGAVDASSDSRGSPYKQRHLFEERLALCTIRDTPA